MTQNSEFISSLSSFIKDNTDYQVKCDNNTLNLYTNVYTGISLRLSAEDDDKVGFYINVKTSSWQYDGCRTDVHDIISLAFSMMFRISSTPISFTTFFDGTFPDPKGLFEIGETYLVPNQSASYFISKDETLGFFKKIIVNIVFFEKFLWSTLGCPCHDCTKEIGEESNFSYQLPKAITNKIDKVVKINQDRTNTSIRISPEWIYYRNFKEKVTIIKSLPLINLIKLIAKSFNDKPIEYRDTKYIFYMTKLSNGVSLNNVLPITKFQQALKIISGLEKLKEAPSLIILENRFALIGKEWIVVKDSACDIDSFKAAREEIRGRIEYEKSLFFVKPRLKWANKIDGGDFESLVKDLLEREDDVIWVRKSGLTNEADGGRDLIANMRPERLAYVSKGENKESGVLIKPIIKVVVQCKALSKSVGKSDVTDIRDTIEKFESQGYFLVVSGYIASSLINFLDSLSTKKYFTNWWTRDELEMRLLRNEDLIAKYPRIITVEC